MAREQCPKDENKGMQEIYILLGKMYQDLDERYPEANTDLKEESSHMNVKTIERLKGIQDTIENAAALAEEANAIVQTFYTAHADEVQPEVMPCEVTALGAADSLHHIYSDQLEKVVRDLMKLIKEK